LKIGSGSNNVTVTCARPGEGTFRSQLKMMLSKMFGFLLGQPKSQTFILNGPDRVA
jgi:hypothetical protein